MCTFAGRTRISLTAPAFVVQFGTIENMGVIKPLENFRRLLKLLRPHRLHDEAEVILKILEVKMTDAFKQDMLEMGTRIRTIRTYKGVSLEKLAKLTKVMPQELLQIESGEISPDIRTIVTMADALEGPFSAIQPKKLDQHLSLITASAKSMESMKSIDSMNFTASTNYAKNLSSEDLHADFLSEIKAQKKLDVLLSDTHYTLCNCLKELMIRAGWKDANIFWDRTLVHRNYFFKINSNKLGKIRKNTLMAICVGLGLTVLTVQKVFKKAELFLSESSMPDRLYMSIIEKAPGIVIDEFNQILIGAGQAPLGTRERER